MTETENTLPINGITLAELRQKSGLTQRQASEASGVGRTTIQGIENERYSPSVDVLERLLKVYNAELKIICHFTTH